MGNIFNNQSNDYINPDLAPCAGQSDTNTFQFLNNQQVGIVSGSSIIASMALSDISQDVEGWIQQTKTLESGEVTFIQGLTKGISNRTQLYLWDGSVAYTGANHSLYMSSDISINYYKSFKYYNSNLHVTADPDEGIDIANAFNIAFDGLGILIDATYDASGLTFTGTQAGYAFNVTAMDVSLWEPDASIVGQMIYEDTSSGIPAFKYPNGAMLGYVLKVTYPSTETDTDCYVKLNHVPDYLTYYEASTGNTNSYVKYTKAVDAGLNGESTSTTLSAGDYLYHVEQNNLWEKIGLLKMWLTAPDPDGTSVENLITGFYVFNPQTFAVKLDYMTIL